MNVINVMMPIVISVSPETTVGEAIKLMLKHHISGLPVMDREQKLVGMLSEGDFLRRAEIGTEPTHGCWLSRLLMTEKLAAEFVRSHGRKVGEIMSRDPVTVRETTSLEEVARLMEEHRIKRLPVMRGTKVVGIVSRTDLLRAVMKRESGTRGPVPSDQDIRAQILEQIGAEPWSPAAPLIDVEVNDGRVKLKGAVSFEGQRQGLKIIAENTPGVSEVIDELAWIEPEPKNCA